jgi:catechol 2,3-dioxygenase-like lactoylglutathione lyase family enzyme
MAAPAGYSGRRHAASPAAETAPIRNASSQQELLMNFIARLLCVSATLFILPQSASTPLAQETDQGEFGRQTIDLGVVVRDVEKSVKFYTEAIGFQEQPGFSVPGGFAADAGLTDGKPLEIRVLTLGDKESATKLKLMAVPQAEPKKSDNRFIHSQFGFSYLTVYVKDTRAAMNRLKKAGVKPVAKGPVELPPGLPQGVFLTVVRDPDGNLVELVGPKSDD